MQSAPVDVGESKMKKKRALEVAYAVRLRVVLDGSKMESKIAWLNRGR
jgi:hypothetical protein